jgi:hypothetical protein
MAYAVNRILTKKSFRKALPPIGFFAVMFLLPFLWWPTQKVGLALILYVPLLLMNVFAMWYLSAMERPQLSFLLKAAGVLCILFGAFLLYTFIYRKVCL